MKIYFDTEFVEDGETIRLLSIGMVREDGETYYAETRFSRSALMFSELYDPWLQAHVFPYLGDPSVPKRERGKIKSDLLDFCGPDPEFWAWYADYDWVALCQLFGRMIDLPKHWPMYCNDFRQITNSSGLVKHDVEIDGPEHNALSDAKWLKRAMEEYYDLQTH